MQDQQKYLITTSGWVQNAEVMFTMKCFRAGWNKPNMKTEAVSSSETLVLSISHYKCHTSAEVIFIFTTVRITYLTITVKRKSTHTHTHTLSGVCDLRKLISLV